MRLENTAPDRVYFPTPAIDEGPGFLGWVKVVSVPARGLTVSIQNLTTVHAEADVRAMARALGVFDASVEVSAVLQTDGKSWHFAVAVALYCCRESLPLPVDVYTGEIRCSGQLLEVGPVDLRGKWEVVGVELPRATLQFVPAWASLDAVLLRAVGLTTWANSNSPLGLDYSRLAECDGTHKLDEDLDQSLMMMEVGAWLHRKVRSKFSVSQGYDERRVVEALRCGGHVTLSGVVGMGKSVRSRRIARRWCETFGPAFYVDTTGSEAAFARFEMEFTGGWEFRVAAASRGWKGPSPNPAALVILDGCPQTASKAQVTVLELILKAGAVVLTTRDAPTTRATGGNSANMGTAFHMFVEDPRLLPFCRELAFRLGFPTMHPVVLCEHALRRWEGESHPLAWVLHRLARFQIAYQGCEGDDDGVLGPQLEVWERNGPEGNELAISTLERYGIVNEQGGFSSEYWRDAVAMWSLREDAITGGLSIPANAIGWTHLPTPKQIAAAVPSWPRLLDGDELAGAFIRVIAPVLPDGWRPSENAAGHSVLCDRTGRHRLRLGSRHDHVRASARESDGSWGKWRRCNTIPELWALSRLVPELWRAWGDIPVSGVAESLGWILGATGHHQFLFALESACSKAGVAPAGYLDCVLGFQEGAMHHDVSLSASAITFRVFAFGSGPASDDWEPESLRELVRNEQRHCADGWFFIDLKRALTQWVLSCAESGVLGEYFADAYVPPWRIAYDECAHPADYTPLRELSWCLAGLEWMTARCGEAVYDAVCRLAFATPRLPGHHLFLARAVRAAMREGGIPGSDRMRCLSDWLDHCALRTGLLEGLWYDTMLARERPRIRWETMGPRVGAENVGALSVILSSLDVSELERLRFAIVGPYVGAVLDGVDIWVERVQRSGLLACEPPSAPGLHHGRYEAHDKVRWWCSEGLLALLQGDPVFGVLSRISFEGLWQLTGGNPTPVPLPSVELASSMIAALLGRLQDLVRTAGTTAED
ncbi:hypothetical protein LBMAG42_20180 [Deltaproteobacteria bacterium]|nr:hypothetical protein LBMAG42_20180 [Deltaproteobacteria bacterium]